MNNTVISDNVGSYSTTDGTITLTGFGALLSAFIGDAIQISVIPKNQQTIKPLRNYILKLDQGKTVARGTIDNQNTSTSLTL